jgi:hypothetical protein
MNTDARCLPWRSLGWNWRRRQRTQNRALNDLSLEWRLETMSGSSPPDNERRPSPAEREPNLTLRDLSGRRRPRSRPASRLVRRRRRVTSASRGLDAGSRRGRQSCLRGITCHRVTVVERCGIGMVRCDGCRLWGQRSVDDRVCPRQPQLAGGPPSFMEPTTMEKIPSPLRIATGREQLVYLPTPVCRSSWLANSSRRWMFRVMKIAGARRHRRATRNLPRRTCQVSSLRVPTAGPDGHCPRRARAARGRWRIQRS